MPTGTKNFILLGLLFILVVAAYAATEAYTLANMTVSDVKFNGLNNFSKTGFIANVTTTVSNDGLLSLPVDTVDYTITIDETQQSLASGALSQFTVPAGQHVYETLEIPVQWTPTPQEAAHLLALPTVTARVHATFEIGALSTDHALPVDATFDLKPYLQQFVPQDQQALLGMTFSPQ